jgi:exodeoxyribonuclease V alpha subunit
VQLQSPQSDIEIDDPIEAIRRDTFDAAGQAPWLEWYPGRPLLVTANDYGLRVYNGDTGVVLAGPDGLRAVIAGATGSLDFATSRLSDVETMHAMTIHKSQGSQAEEVTVLMPTEDSRLLTRVVLYGHHTREEESSLVGSEPEVRAAIGRRALRASGLRQRLQATLPTT